MKNQNQLYQKQKNHEITIPAEITAEIVDCSPSLVRQVRSGARNSNKGAGAKVVLVDDLLQSGTTALIEHIKTIVKL